MATFKTINEAGVTTPCSLPVDTNDRDIKNAKPIKDAMYKISNEKMQFQGAGARKAGGILKTPVESVPAGVLSYRNG